MSAILKPAWSDSPVRAGWFSAVCLLVVALTVGPAWCQDTTTPNASSARPPVAPDVVASTDSTVSDSTAKSGPGNAGSKVKQTAERLTDVFSPAKIVASIIVLLVGWVSIRLSTWILTLGGERFSRHRLKFAKLVPIVRICIWTLAIYVIIVDIFSPSTNALFAFTASAGVAIGFASQDILKNIFGGIVIILDRPFQVGDKIQVGSHYGEVTGIGLRTVRIVTPDDNLVSVPNSEIVNQSVSNANAGALDCQVGVEFNLHVDTDTQRVRSILYETAATSPYVFLAKPVVVVFRNAFDHVPMMKAKVKAYVFDNRQENAFASDITERGTRALCEAGLSMIDQPTVESEAS